MGGQGCLYSDENVKMSFMVTKLSKTGRLGCLFEVCVESLSNYGLQQVRFEPVETSHRAFKLDLSGGHAGSVSLAAHGRCVFGGKFDVFGPFEENPQVELSYLLVDNLCRRARLRLPLMVTTFMSGLQLHASKFFEAWNMQEFARTEFVFVCRLRRALLQAGGFFQYMKCLELSGALKQLPGLDDAATSVVLASAFPLRDSSSSVLVRAELATAPSDKGTCRITLRSASNVLNRGLARVLCTMLCELS